MRTVLADSDLTHLFTPLVEATVPIATGQHIAYLGQNGTKRLTDPVRYGMQIHNLEKITQGESLESSQGKISEEFTIEKLTDPCDSDVLAVQALLIEAYSREGRTIMWYDPTIENVLEVLENSLAFVARNSDGQIVSIAAAERATGIIVDERELEIYEISDCATYKDFRGQGLLKGCLLGLLNSKEIIAADCVYTEARIAHTPIIRAFNRLGFELGGVVRNHVLIGGDRDLSETTDIENLAVMYLPRR
ncbi:hypothetical protein HN587_07060 [Candidatus Woesearchaeota archaeon]|jgi:RimJ/RimL family protein N-acetyltransferase|nr:hypothetical protein [Candidatus Woesearchaeota archaeon]